MNTLFIIGLLLIAAFSFTVSAYLSFYSLELNSIIAKSITFAVLGVIFTLVTFTISLIIVWPGA